MTIKSAELIEEETIEIIFQEIGKIRREVERNKAIIEFTQESMNNLREEFRILKAKIKLEELE